MKFWKKILKRFTHQEKKPYPRSFAKRLTWRIMLMLLIVMGLISTIIVTIGWTMTIGLGGLLLDNLLSDRTNKVEHTLTEVYVSTINTVPNIEDNLQRPERMQGIVKRIVELNPHIRSCGISFREDYYPKKGHWFCPYAQRLDNDSVVVKQSIGDKNQDYLHEQWFQKAMKAKDSYWSDPFFDGTDHQTPLVALLVPIRDERDSTVAVLGVDMSLERLSKDVSIVFFDGNDFTKEWSAEEKMYYFITDSTGTFLVHPHKEHIINQNFIENAKQSETTIDDYAVNKIMKEGESGYLLGDDNGDDIIIDGEEVMVCYSTIDHTPWKMTLVLPTFFVNLVFYIVGGLFVFFILIGLIVVFFAGRRGIKKTSEPLRQLAASANEVAKGNFDAQLPDIKSRDEIHLLRDSFENMQHSLTRYVNELRDATAQKATMESELKIAHDIQMSMLPKTFPPYPERDDIDIYGSLTPAKAVGGDLFDFFIRDNQLFFCIGDVAGKGIPASLFMAVVRSLFRNISAHVASPERISYTLNNALAESNETSMFVTLFTGVLDLATGHLRYCNAGHNSPLLIGRKVGELPCLPNLPLGITTEFQFDVQEIDIDPQTTIFLFTDGLTEAENAQHDQFGDERTFQIADRMLANRQHQPQQLIQEMRQEVHRFVGDAEQSDDLTMLAVQYKPLG